MEYQIKYHGKSMDDYLSKNAESPMVGQTIHQPTLKFRLEQAVKDAESRLEDAKRARDILNKNPDLEELLNIMQRGRF